jgi:hypothetical protein
MRHLLYSYLGFLGLVLGVCGLLSLGITLVRTRSKNKNENESLSSFWQRIFENTRKERLIRLLIRVSFLLVGFFVGSIGGYGFRDHQLANNMFFYTEVMINPPTQINTDYDMQPARMKPIPTKICKSTVDWRFGEELADVTFEQLVGCKRIISYHRPLKGEIHASIQMR